MTGKSPKFQVSTIITRLFFSIQLLCLSNCVSTYTSAKLPNIEDFAEAGLTYKLSGTVNETKKAATNFLTDKNILSKELRQEPYSYIITAFLREPEKTGERRIRRTSYIIRLKEADAKGSCTEALISWLIQSKGIREETWRNTETDEGYSPSTLEEVKKLFKDKKCRQ